MKRNRNNDFTEEVSSLFVIIARSSNFRRLVKFTTGSAGVSAYTRVRNSLDRDRSEGEQPAGNFGY